MSNYRRTNLAGATYFFTVVTYRRQPIFQDSLARQFLREAILKTQQNYPFTIDA
jgi:putative transposase